MKVTRLKLDDLHAPEENVRYHTEAQLKEFERSVRMFGQIRPLVVDENHVILAGNGLYETLKRMGKTEADCYVISNLSDNQKKKLMIADNKVYSLGVDNNEMLDKIIADLGDDLDIPGYDEEVLRQMNAEAATITEQISGYGRLDDTQIGEKRQAGERRDEHIAQAQTPEAGSTEVTDSQEAGEHATAVPQTETEAGRYVICPNCGERIWF